MNELHCNVPLVDKLTSQFQRFEGYYYLIENVPAFVCPRCEEEFLTPQTIEAITAYLQQNPEPIRSEKLEFLDLSLAV